MGDIHPCYSVPHCAQSRIVNMWFKIMWFKITMSLRNFQTARNIVTVTYTLTALSIYIGPFASQNPKGHCKLDVLI
jgi:hypothetical protein